MMIDATEEYSVIIQRIDSLTNCLDGQTQCKQLDIQICNVITKGKVGSLTMQPAKHDVTAMPL